MNKAIFTKARWQTDSEGQWIAFKVFDAAKIAQSIEEGKKYELTIKEYRPARSKDANAYCWALLGKLSGVLRIPPIELYRQYIPDVGDNYVIVPVRADILSEWEHIWAAGHDGRIVVDMGECRNTKGYHNMRCYIGSSDYDTKQMARLIDLIIEDCKENGIETITDSEKQKLIEEWGKNERS